MKINQVQKSENKSIILTVRITPTKKEWIDTNKISPTKVFNQALEELYKKDEVKKIHRNL